MNKLNINRNYKDSLFCAIFKDKDALLSLYNAVNNSAYTNSEDLQVTTLENVIYVGIKNDLSFLISDTMNLYEHQSTYNPNMPLRGLFYFSDLYQAYIDTNEFNIYSRDPLTLPLPQYIVFYNGTSDEPDRKALHLSDLFIGTDNTKPCLECEAIQININHGHNKILIERCHMLYEYSIYISMIRDNLQNGLYLSEAIDAATDTCIKTGILEHILRKNRAEVRRMILTEYDEEFHIKSEKKISYQKGIFHNQTTAILNMMAKNYSISDIASIIDLRLDRIEQVIALKKEDESRTADDIVAIMFRQNFY